MKEEQKRKITQLLWYGIAGAVLTMIGDFLLLGVDSTGAEGAISQYLMAAEKISYTRIGLAGFFGFVGIPVTAFGYYALYQMMEDRESAAARWYKASVYAFAAFGGAIHILLSGNRYEKGTGNRNRKWRYTVHDPKGAGRISDSLFCCLFCLLSYQHHHAYLYHCKKENTASGLDVDPESSSFQDPDQWIWKTGNQCIL